MVISLLHPSRGRPVKAYETARKWIEQAGCDVEHIFSLDNSDHERGRYSPHDKMTINDNNCVVQATNIAAQVSKGDLLLYLSDDFDAFNGWGKKIIEIASKYEGMYMIKVDDGLQRFDNAVLTVPIMSRPLYERLGYFFHPHYKSMWVDVDLFHTCDILGVIKYHPEVKFMHNHYSNGKAKKDATYERSDGFWNQGKDVLRVRKMEGFKC